MVMCDSCSFGVLFSLACLHPWLYQCFFLQWPHPIFNCLQWWATRSTLPSIKPTWRWDPSYPRWWRLSTTDPSEHHELTALQPWCGLCSTSATTYLVSYWFNRSTPGSSVLYDTTAIVLWLYICADYQAWLLEVPSVSISSNSWCCVL
jgi:hypothetical protein